MKEVPIPGGVARFREKLRTRDRMLVQAAGIAASSVFSRLPLDSGDEDQIQKAADEQPITLDEAMRVLAVKSAMIVAFLESWTLPMPLPSMETIGDLDPEVYDALEEAVDSFDASAAETNFAQGDPRAPGYEETPTTGSTDSSEPSSVDPQKTSTSTPQPATESTPSAASTPA